MNLGPSNYMVNMRDNPLMLPAYLALARPNRLAGTFHSGANYDNAPSCIIVPSVANASEFLARRGYEGTCTILGNQAQARPV